MFSRDMENAVSRKADAAPAARAIRRVTSITATLNTGLIDKVSF
jgi:hypothetical protein